MLVIVLGGRIWGCGSVMNIEMIQLYVETMLRVNMRGIYCCFMRIGYGVFTLIQDQHNYNS